MRGKTSIAVAIMVAGISADFGIASPPIAMPSPCPCCTDGVCRPKRETWGHYRTQWRRWPGDYRPDAPGTGEPSAKGQFPPELAPVEIPRPEIEDRRAPESFKERQRRQEAADERLELRPLPGAGGGPAVQDDFDFDAPPGPPRGGPLGPPPVNGPPPGLPNLDNFQLPTDDPQGNLDMPPRPPHSVVQYATHLSKPTAESSILVTRAFGTGTSNSTIKRLPSSKVQEVGRAVFLEPIANPAR